MSASKSQTTSTLSRVLYLIGAMFLVISLFVPLWRIELDAPQYPEGLALQIYPNKIAGDVDIVNGLNHYIGMKTLHTEDFIEFTLLPYLIGFFAGLFLLAAIWPKKKVVYGVFWAFVAFGVVAMVDFWRWEYNYGHDLDPNAAIQVPGMAYQPPLIGFKQLLNFGAYSIPDTGGWLFLGAGLLALIAVLLESGLVRPFSKSKSGKGIMAAIAWLTISLTACGDAEPKTITLNRDECNHCKMPISDGRFAAELATDKGRVFVFDDLTCLLGYMKENSSTDFENRWVADYEHPEKWLQADKAIYIVSEELKSPMGGNTAAFSTDAAAQGQAARLKTQVLTWNQVQEDHE